MLTLETVLELRTNLVIKDGILQTLEKSKEFPVVLNGVRKLMWLRLSGQKPQLPFDILELPGRNSALNTIKSATAYCITSLRRRSSAKSPGCESKRFSNVIKRVISPSALFLTATFSCRRAYINEDRDE